MKRVYSIDMKKSLYANWKMNKTRLEVESFFAELNHVGNKTVGIAGSFTLLETLVAHAPRLGVLAGAQTMSEYASGAFTGEVSATQLKDVGTDFVILGHSERRHIMIESNESIGKKVERAVCEAIPFILCVGETLDERELDQTESILKKQLEAAFESVLEDQLKEVKIAYEPVWAIGTGKAATTKMADDTHELIREIISELYTTEVGGEMPILYGGSVTNENLEKYLSEPNIDGALVGGAALDALNFNQMIQMLED